MSNHIPVLIVGAGPTGLTFAIQLQRYGIPFRIIDKQTKPVITSNALAVQICTLEIWNELGILSKALPLGNKIEGLNIFSNKTRIANIELKDVKSSFPFILGLSQHQTETIMLEDLKEKNVHVEMNTDLISFAEKGSQISVSIQHLDRQVETLTTDWLIACDGGHSLIREKLNIPFQGKELPEHFVLADAEIKSELSPHQAYIFSSSDGPFMLIHYNHQYTRIIAEVSHDPILKQAKTLTFDQVKQLAKERFPFTMQISEPVWTSGFWIHEKIIKEYQHGHIFFVGDAAHIHSPAGGQGMNTGIQDAYNLSWKLALVLKNELNPQALSTYQQERKPVGEKVLKETTALTRMVSMHNPFLVFLRNIFVAFIFKFKFFRRAFANNFSQIKLHYSENLLIKNNAKFHLGPKAGTRMRDVMYDNKKLSDLTQGPQFCLLIFTSTYNFHIDSCLKLKNEMDHHVKSKIKIILITYHNLCPEWNDEKIVDDTLRIHKAYGVTDPQFFLIRPDKYIGFRDHLSNSQKLLDFLNDFLI
jgi:2-polyprenyl-6-methoxyphenol hydroxylase-like FAD-dependent oxidoreductase